MKPTRVTTATGSGRPGQASRPGLRPVADRLPAIAAKSLAARGLGRGDLLRAWPEIVGATLAAHASPLRLTYPRRDKRTEGTLTISVDPAYALELQHLEPQLLERINATCGYRAVARIVLRQSWNGWTDPPPAPAAEDTPVPPDLAARLADIDDEDVRSALGRLANAVAQSPSKA